MKTYYNNKENRNDLSLPYRPNRSYVQKSHSCNKNTQKNAASLNKKDNTSEENVKYPLENSIQDKLSSLSRINSVVGTAETNYLNKNIEDFLLMKTQPSENLLLKTQESSKNNHYLTEISDFSNAPNSKNSRNPPKIYEEILEQMQNFKRQKEKKLENTINYMLKKYDIHKKHYFDFLQEKDLLTLRFLIQILYDKLEKTNDSSENKEKIEELQKKIQESQRSSSVLHDEMLEKNIKINTLSTKFYILLQRTKDFYWLIAETRKELRKLLSENNLNFTLKATLENLIKEFEILENKVQEFENNEISEEIHKKSQEELSFMKKFDKSRKNIQQSFKFFFNDGEALKENKGLLNKSSNELIDLKNTEILQNEIKNNHEKIIFLIEEKNRTEKTLYDTQLLNREFSLKLAEMKMKYEEKEYEIKNLREKISDKNKEIQIILENKRVFQETLATENLNKEKNDAKLQMIEKELNEIKKITASKENEYYMLDLKNKQFENENVKLNQRLKELEQQNENLQEKLKLQEKKADLEAIIQYLSTIILSKPNYGNSSNNDQLAINLRNICGDNIFKILEEIYKKFHDSETERQNLIEKLREEEKNKKKATNAALYFAKNLLNILEVIDKANDEKNFRLLIKEKMNTISEMKFKYMEVINELALYEEENKDEYHPELEMSFTVKEKKLKNFNSSEKKYKDNAKENNFNRVPLVEKTNNSNNNNLSFSSLNVSEKSPNKTIDKQKSPNCNDSNAMHLFLINQAASIEQLLKIY